MKWKESAASRDRSLANIKLFILWLSSPRHSAGLEKENASAAGKHTYVGIKRFFFYTKLKSRLKRMFLAIKKKNNKKKKKIK